VFALLLPLIWALAQWLGGPSSEDPPAPPTVHASVAANPHTHR